MDLHVIRPATHTTQYVFNDDILIEEGPEVGGGGGGV